MSGMRSLWSQISELPLPVRYACVGGGLFAAIGVPIGLIRGLSYPATALFAMGEGAVLIGAAGAALGFAAGVIAAACCALWRALR